MSTESNPNSKSGQTSAQTRLPGPLLRKNKEDSDVSNDPKLPESPLSDSFLSKSICSATDCTGLMPTPPTCEAELEAYEEMYQFCIRRPVQKEDS